MAKRNDRAVLLLTRDMEKQTDVNTAWADVTKFTLLTYDVPEETGYENPSWVLRRVAVRLTKSAWVLPSDQVPRGLLQEFDEAGVEWTLFDMADYEADRLRELARRELTRFLQSMAVRMLRNLASAQSRYEEALRTMPAELRTAEAEDRVQRNLLNRMRAVLKGAEQELNDAVQAAETFDQTMFVQDLVAAMQASLAAQKATLAAAVAAREAAVAAREAAVEAAQQETAPPVQRELAFTE